MKKLAILVAIAALLAGCQGSDDGIDHDAVAKAQAPLIAAAKRSGGDWSKLNPDERKLFLDRTQGNEDAAKQMVGMMAHGPGKGSGMGPKR